MIRLKIDCTKIEKGRLFKGKPDKSGKCAMYLDAVLIQTKQTSYGDWRDNQTHMIVQSVSQEERAKGVKGPIIGNATDSESRRTNDQAPADPAEEKVIADEDCPF